VLQNVQNNYLLLEHCNGGNSSKETGTAAVRQ
jgi:hypothetical protein